jgi:hypothetical protein
MLHTDHQLWISRRQRSDGARHGGRNELLLDLGIAGHVRPDVARGSGGDAVVAEQVQWHTALEHRHRIAADNLTGCRIDNRVERCAHVGDVHLAGRQLRIGGTAVAVGNVVFPVAQEHIALRAEQQPTGLAVGLVRADPDIHQALSEIDVVDAVVIGVGGGRTGTVRARAVELIDRLGDGGHLRQGLQIGIGDRC